MSLERLEETVTREYPDRGSGIFMNAASWGLVPRSAAVESAGLTLRRNLGRGFAEDEIGPWQRRCREAAARLIGVTPVEIALSANTSYGVNVAAALVAAGRPGRIVVSEGEFPANVLPWRALERDGFDVQFVPTDAHGWPDEDALIRAVAGRDVRALAVSSVQYVTGYRADLARLGASCRERGILFCVDAIQSLGATPLDAPSCHVDVLACGGQKWLCSPWGSGFTYVRREVQARFEPPMVGWLSVRGATRFEEGLSYGTEWVDDARKFELATLALQDHLGMARAIEIFLEVGVETIARHLVRVNEPLVAWLEGHPEARPITPLDPTRRAGIFSFTVPEVQRVAAALRDGGVTFSVREGAIRLAPHFYNTAEEMREVVRLLG